MECAKENNITLKMRAQREPRCRRKFTPEFKQDAVRMVIVEGLSVKEVAEKLGIERSSLGRWKREYLEQLGGLKSGVNGHENALTPKEMDGEIRDLRRQLRESELQRQILKKALAIFSRESDSGISS